MLKTALYFTAGLLIFCGVRRALREHKPQVVASGGRNFEGNRRQGGQPSKCPPAVDAQPGANVHPEKKQTKTRNEPPDQATADAAAVFEPGTVREG